MKCSLRWRGEHFCKGSEIFNELAHGDRILFGVAIEFSWLWDRHIIDKMVDLIGLGNSWWFSDELGACGRGRVSEGVARLLSLQSSGLVGLRELGLEGLQLLGQHCDLLGKLVTRWGRSGCGRQI